MEKEVFKSDYYNKAPVSKILGKCVVMFVKVNVVFIIRNNLHLIIIYILAVLNVY